MGEPPCPGGCCLTLAGIAAPMACTVLPPLLTAHLLPRRPSLPRWLPLSSVMEPPAQEVAALMLAGTAALMACTVLPPLLTAHLLQRRPSSQRRLILSKWLPLSSVMVLSALLAAAPMLAGSAALMLSIISTGLLPKSRKISFNSYFNNLLQKHKM